MMLKCAAVYNLDGQGVHSLKGSYAAHIPSAAECDVNYGSFFFSRFAGWRTFIIT